MTPLDSNLGSDPSYHSHKPGERRFSEDPVVFPEKEPRVRRMPSQSLDAPKDWKQRKTFPG